MRTRLVPLALLAALGLAALDPATAFAQQYSTSTRPNYYAPSNYGTPNASMYKPRNYGTPGISYAMPNPYRYLPNYATLSAGTPTPLGIVPLLPGTLITGSNYGAPPAANLPLPADGGPISVNVQPSAALLVTPNPAEAPAGTPTPENPAEAPAGTPATDATTGATTGTPAGGAFVPSALTAPSAAPSTATPYTTPSLNVPRYSPSYVPAYGSFAPAPQYPASISSALNRVYGYKGY